MFDETFVAQELERIIPYGVYVRSREAVERQRAAIMTLIKDLIDGRERALVQSLRLLKSIVQDLPSKRDWLDPAIEAEARSMVEGVNLDATR